MTVLNRARCVLIKLTQILKVTHFPAFHADLTSWVGNDSTYNDYYINAPPTWTFLIVTTGSLRTGSLTWTAPILWSWIVTCAAPWHVTASAGLWTSGPFAPDSPFSINWHWNETRKTSHFFGLLLQLLFTFVTRRVALFPKLVTLREQTAATNVTTI